MEGRGQCQTMSKAVDNLKLDCSKLLLLFFCLLKFCLQRVGVDMGVMPPTIELQQQQ